jgi:hypothetical protein
MSEHINVTIDTPEGSITKRVTRRQIAKAMEAARRAALVSALWQKRSLQLFGTPDEKPEVIVPLKDFSMMETKLQKVTEASVKIAVAAAMSSANLSSLSDLVKRGAESEADRAAELSTGI